MTFFCICLAITALAVCGSFWLFLAMLVVTYVAKAFCRHLGMDF